MKSPRRYLPYWDSKGVVPSCGGRRSASVGSALVLPAPQCFTTSAIGSLGWQPGPGYAKIDTPESSFTGAWLEAERNNLVVASSSIFSTPDKQSLRFLAVRGGVTSMGEIRPRYRSSV